MQYSRPQLLFLTLVHPDFLPPVYATAQSLRDEGYSITIIAFDSFTPAPVNVGEHIDIVTMGPHHKVSLRARLALRSRFKARAQEELKRQQYKAIIAFCPFSYNTAIGIKEALPVFYYAMEIADFTIENLKRSPLTAVSAYKTLHSLNQAYMVATPSFQRSAWLAGRAHLAFMPETILNTAYRSEKVAADDREVLKNILPAHVFEKKMVLYTGAVNDRLCVGELVEAFDAVGDPATVLVITGFKDNAYCNGIRQFVAASAHKDSIFLLPYVTREEMLALQAVADIGACLMKEIPGMIASQMIAPNKTGEYLDKELFILGVRNFYMNMFEAAGVAALAASPAIADIAVALKEALVRIRDGSCRARINNYVAEYFCMQKQVAPFSVALRRL